MIKLLRMLSGRINIALILGVTILASGCATPIIKMSPEVETRLRGKSFVVLHRSDKFCANITGRFFNRDAPGWLYKGPGQIYVCEQRGAEIIDRFKLIPPQDRMIEPISDHLERTYGMKRVRSGTNDPSTEFAHSATGRSNFHEVAAHYLNKVDYVIEVQGYVTTMNTFTVNRYDMNLISHIAFHDNVEDLGNPILFDQCLGASTPLPFPVDPSTGVDSLAQVKDKDIEIVTPTYKEMLDNNAELLNTMFGTMTNRCLQYHLNNSL